MRVLVQYECPSTTHFLRGKAENGAAIEVNAQNRDGDTALHWGVLPCVFPFDKKSSLQQTMRDCVRKVKYNISGFDFDFAER